MEVIQKVRATVDKAIDAAITWIVAKAKALFASLFSGKSNKPDERSRIQKKADLAKGIAEAKKLLDNQDLSTEEVKGKLPGIKSKYKITIFELVTDAKSETKETDHIHGEIHSEVVKDDSGQAEKEVGETKYVMMEGGVRVLRPKYRPALMIRTRFYGLGHRYSSELRSHMSNDVKARTIKQGPNKDTHWIGDPVQPTREVPLTNPTHPTIEHRPSVVTHWNDGGDGSPAGRNSNQGSRFDWKNFKGRETQARVLDAKTNQSLGGGGNYIHEVLPGFKGPAED